MVLFPERRNNGGFSHGNNSSKTLCAARSAALTKMEPRPYQAEDLQTIERKFGQGVRRQLLRYATGLGKTVVFANLRKRLGMTGRKIVMAHRDELIEQAYDKLAACNPGVKVGIEKGSYRSDGEAIVVSSVQTLGRAGSTRLAQFDPSEFDALVIDECFPAGTLVGGVPVETIKAGDGTLAYSVDSQTVVSRKVLNVFKNKASSLVRVAAGDKRVVCTPNHPFLTDRGWVAAAELAQTDNVRLHKVLHRVRNASYREADNIASAAREKILQQQLHDGGYEPTPCVFKNEETQPHARQLKSAEDERFAEENTAQTYSKEGQRHGSYCSAAYASFESSSGDGGCCSDESAKGERLPNLLQIGLSEQSSQVGCGDRREFTLCAGEESARCEEGSTIEIIRVDSVTVLQPGSDGTFGGVCPDGFVYNLEVDQDHTYIANGFVVHNCHHALSKGYLSVINHFMQNQRTLLLGVTATPVRGDGRGLNEVFQEIVADRDMLWGIKEGWLVDLRGIRIVTKTDLSDVETLAKDFNMGQLGRKLNTPYRNDIILRSWLEHAPDRQTVIFTAGVQHAKDLAELFKKQGVAAEAVWGEDPDRHSKIVAHKAGNLRVLMNDSLLTEGYDDWRIACIGMGCSTQSSGRYTQRLGRGTRIPDGIGNLVEARAAGLHIAKHDCLVLDFVDDTRRHSLVTMPTLYGLNKDLDFKGRTLSAVMDEVAELQAARQSIDLSGVTDAGKFSSYAEEVDLFRVEFAPEVVQISEFQWHKTGVDAYVLLLMNSDHVTVMRDSRGVWQIVGQVNEREIRDSKPSFDEAIREADYKVQLLGGRTIANNAKRDLKKDGDRPSPAQLIAAKRLRIPVPAGATFGEVRKALSRAIALRRGYDKKAA